MKQIRVQKERAKGTSSTDLYNDDMTLEEIRKALHDAIQKKEKSK